MSPKPLAASRKLLAWYDKNGRELPWRVRGGVKPDPYRVWLSEIMLQQTTVVTVGPYYRKFLAKWPTLQRLAKAKPAEVLRAWAGLGYYRRAHLLMETARRVVKDFGGVFPDKESEIGKLPGFGPYTTAALLAIAFNKRANVVDGNVERVMARLFAVRIPLPKAKPKLKELAQTLLPKTRYGDYAQALMDLGATVCTPRNPKCDVCPWASICHSRALGLAESLPRRNRAKTKPVRRAMAFFLMNEQGAVLLRRRPLNGLLAGMMEIPTSEWREGAIPTLAEALSQAPIKARWKLLNGSIRHVFSHFDLELKVAAATISHKVGIKGRWVSPAQLEREALPSLMRKVVDHARERMRAA